MSTETTTAVEPKRESLFSKKNRKLLTDPLDDSNPITVQVLGICSALAITVQVQQAVIMSLAVLFVMIGGNVIVSMMRNIIPDRIRIIVQLAGDSPTRYPGTSSTPHTCTTEPGSNATSN